MVDNRPISEIFAEEGKTWAEAEAAASILEDTKSSYLKQMVLEIRAGDSKIAYNQAEALAMASPEWMGRVLETIEARKQANLWKVRLESLRMAYGEWNSEKADERLQAKL